MPKVFTGTVKAKVVSARFSISGQVVKVNKSVGDSVKEGELLASLDRTILQTQLDKELADFRKVRGDFEVFNQKNPNPTTELDNYLKTQKQASLDASVKMVEIAKAKLDQCSLFSPVNGVIIDDSDIAAKIYVTPSSGEIKIIDTNSFYFEIELKQEDVTFFEKERKVKITIDETDLKFEGKTNPIISDGKNFFVRISIKEKKGLLIGLHGKASF